MSLEVYLGKFECLIKKANDQKLIKQFSSENLPNTVIAGTSALLLSSWIFDNYKANVDKETKKEKPSKKKSKKKWIKTGKSSFLTEDEFSSDTNTVIIDNTKYEKNDVFKNDIIDNYKKETNCKDNNNNADDLYFAIIDHQNDRE